MGGLFCAMSVPQILKNEYDDVKPQIYFALALGLYKQPAHSRQRGVFSFERNGLDREQSAFPR